MASSLNDWDILADNQSNVHILRNKQLLKDIRKAPKPITICGIGGSLRVTQCGDFGTIKGVYYHPAAVANVLCFADLVSRYAVKYDNSVGDYFVVDTGKCVVRFLQIGKLYILNAHDTGAVSMTIRTVEGNSVSFTKLSSSG